MRGTVPSACRDTVIVNGVVVVVVVVGVMVEVVVAVVTVRGHDERQQ